MGSGVRVVGVVGRWRGAGRPWKALARVLQLVLTLSVIGAVELSSATATLPAPLDTSTLSALQARDLMGASVVQVSALACDMAVREGTAVAVGPGKLLTNAHVAGETRLLDLVPEDGPLVVGGPTTASLRADLAVIDAAGLHLAPLPLAPRDAAPGTSVRVGGYPRASSAPAAEGMVVQEAKVVDYVDGSTRGQLSAVMRLDTPVRPGMSGGPVIDGAGRLAGIIFASESPSDFALAIPASALRRLLAGTSFVASHC